MARIGEYDRRRRLMMQAVMWVILLAVLGLAALVDHSRQTLPRRYGPILCQLPAGWVSATPLAADPRLVASVMEPDNGDESRQLAIYCDNAPPNVDAEHYLDGSGLLSELVKADPHTERIIRLGEPGTIAGAPAIRVVARIPITTDDGGTQIQTPVMALCAVLPDHLAIAIVIWHDPGVDETDGNLLDAVAATISEAGK